MSVRNFGWVMGMPVTRTGQFHKLSCPYEGPYPMVARYPNGAEVHPVGKPTVETIQVAPNRL